MARMKLSALPPGPPRVLARTLKYRDAEEHLLRRLGAAMVLHWDELSDTLQDLLIDQAAAVTDRDAAEPGAIENFIRTAKSVTVAAPKPETDALPSPPRGGEGVGEADG